jgi:hypothetical protein
VVFHARYKDKKEEVKQKCKTMWKVPLPAQFQEGWLMTWPWSGYNAVSKVKGEQRAEG